jgi:hypothetical protein
MWRWIVSFTLLPSYSLGKKVGGKQAEEIEITIFRNVTPCKFRR